MPPPATRKPAFDGAVQSTGSTAIMVPRWPALVVALVALLACLYQLERSAPPLPWSDETEYLKYGSTLAETGRYAYTPAGPGADPGPGREPLYPLLVAAAIRIDPVLGERIDACIGNRSDATCPRVFQSLRWANALLIAAAAALTFLAARTLDAAAPQCRIAGLYLALNLNLIMASKFVISDYLALALAAGLAFALIAALALALIVTRRREFAAALLAILVGTGILAGGWAARNDAIYGRATVTDERGGMALSTREVFDHMTAGEYAASFLWWMRGPGRGLARKLFPERDWHRFDWYVDDGFYEMGEYELYEARIKRLMDEQHFDRAAAQAHVPSVIAGEIARELPMYFATMVPLTYRGLWFDEFIVFGFPALVWLLVGAIGRRDWARLAALSPAVFCLLVYPATTLNIDRFQYPAGPGIALAGGMAAVALYKRFRPRS